MYVCNLIRYTSQNFIQLDCCFHMIVFDEVTEKYCEKCQFLCDFVREPILCKARSPMLRIIVHMQYLLSIPRLISLQSLLSEVKLTCERCRFLYRYLQLVLISKFSKLLLSLPCPNLQLQLSSCTFSLLLLAFLVSRDGNLDSFWLGQYRFAETNTLPGWVGMGLKLHNNYQYTQIYR